MRYEFNPPPNWPRPPRGWRPPVGWVAPPEWGPPPEGWQMWVPAKRSAWAHPVMIVLYVLLGTGLVYGMARVPPGDDAATDTPSTSAPPSTPADATTDEPTDPATTTPATTKPAKKKPVVYRHLTQRQWRQIAKDPDAHMGEHYVVYGQVTQFDAATGTDTYRADVGGVRDACSYGLCTYPTNTILTGEEDRLSKLVEEDVFRAKVTVMGSMDYETQIGGETTVPLLQVDRVKVIG